MSTCISGNALLVGKIKMDYFSNPLVNLIISPDIDTLFNCQYKIKLINFIMRIYKFIIGNCQCMDWG